MLSSQLTFQSMTVLLTLWPTQISSLAWLFISASSFVNRLARITVCWGPTPPTLSFRVLTRASEKSPLVLLGELVPEGAADGAAGSCLL